MSWTSSTAWVLFHIFLFSTFEDGLDAQVVDFRPNTCRFNRSFFSDQYYPENGCMRATCYPSRQMLIVETCAPLPPTDRSCRFKAEFINSRFPYCCTAYTCAEEQVATFGITRTYTADETIDLLNKRVVEASGYWSAETRYVLSACSEGTCWYSNRIIPPGGALLDEPCEAVNVSYGNEYVIVKSCPKFDLTTHECAMVGVGDSPAQYPICCPLYMCPPTGYQHRTAHLENAPVPFENGQCNYKGTRFTESLVTSTECVNLTCDSTRRSITGNTCLETKQLGRSGCVDVSGQKKFWNGPFPKCCPDLICPDMTVESGVPEKQIHATEVQSGSCVYRKEHFKGTENIAGICERWTCHHEREEVLVESCQETEEDLGENCQWESEDSRAPFPDCCKKKVCRNRYLTRYPRQNVPASLRKQGRSL